MAKSIEVTLKLNDRDFIQGLRKSNRELDKLQRNLKQTGSSAKGLSGQQGMGGLTTAIAAVGAATVATTGQQGAQVRLSRNLVDQVQKTANQFKRLRDSLIEGTIETKDNVKKGRELYNVQRKVSTAAKNLTQEQIELEKGQTKANQGFAKGGTRLLKFAGIAAVVAGAVAGITIGLRQLAGSIQTAARFQDIETTLTNITGSAEAGAYALSLVKEEATKLPIAFDELAGSAPVLSTISGDLGDLRDNINLAADISAQFGIGFTEAASSLQRAFSAGAGAADIFRERGVLAAAGFEAGVSYSIDETIAKLKEYGTTIEGAAQTLSKTFTGAVSQAGDRLTLFQAAMGEETLPFFTATLQELVGVFDETGDAAFATARNIGENVVQGFQNAVIGGAYLIDVLEAAKTAFIEIVTLGGLLDGAYAAIGNALKDLGLSIGEGLDGIIDFDKAEAARKFFDSVSMTSEQIKRTKKTGDAITDAFKIPKTVSEDVEEVVDALTEFRNQLDNVRNISGEEYTRFLDRLNELYRTGEIGIEDYRNTLRDLDEQFGENEGLNNFLDTLGTAQKTLSEDLVEAFRNGESASGSFKKMFNTLINQIIADVIRLSIIQPILSAILGPFGYGFGTGGSIVKIPGKASGGPVMGNRPYVVGEKGPELFVPQGAGSIVPNHQMGGGQVTYNINAIDTKSFEQRLAQNPEYIYNLTRVGSRRVPG